MLSFALDQVDIEEPTISISGRQLQWLKRIFGGSEVRSSRYPQRNPSDVNLMQKALGGAKPTGAKRTSNVRRNGASENAIDRLWTYIVGENGYAVEEDVAELLGLDGTLSGDVPVDDPMVLVHMLEQAGLAGGFTWRVRIRTPDVEARDELKKVKEQLREERKQREQFKDIEALVGDAKTTVQRVEEEASILRQKNEALKAELADLERMVCVGNPSVFPPDLFQISDCSYFVCFVCRAGERAEQEQGCNYSSDGSRTR